MKLNKFFQSSMKSLLGIGLWVVSGLSVADKERIISAGGSVTEIIYELGLGNRLVAVDTSSLYPKAVHQLPKIGYYRALSAEGVLSLEPTMIVAARGAGPAAVLRQFDDIGIPVKLFEQDEYTLESWQTLIRDVGAHFSKKVQAESIISRVLGELKAHQATINYPKNQLNVVALLSIGQRGPLVAGRNTMPDLLFRLAGLNNIGALVEGYKPLSSEVMAQSKIDLVLVPSHLEETLGGAETMCANVLLKLSLRTDCRVKVLDGLLLMGMGTRIDNAVEQIVSEANFINNQMVEE